MAVGLRRARGGAARRSRSLRWQALCWPDVGERRRWQQGRRQGRSARGRAGPQGDSVAPAAGRRGEWQRDVREREERAAGRHGWGPGPGGRLRRECRGRGEEGPLQRCLRVLACGLLIPIATIACRDQYSPLMTKNEPRMVPASFDFCFADLKRGASSGGTSMPSESLKPTARFFLSSIVYITL